MPISSMSIIEHIQNALKWLEGDETNHEVRQVYIRFAWGEVRALNVIFSQDEKWMTIVSMRTESCTETTVAPVNEALAVRKWGGPL